MHRHPALHVAVSAAVALAFTVHARSSAACGYAAGCDLVRVLPHASGVVPANAPAIAFDDHSVATNFEIYTAAGERVPTTTSTAPDPATGAKYLFLSSPLTEGEAYEVRWANCEGPSRTNSTFTAGPSAPLPTSIGSVTTGPSRRGNSSACGSIFWSDSEDSDGGGEAATFIDLTPSAELLPYLPITTFVEFVDGQPMDLAVDDVGSPTRRPPRLALRAFCKHVMGYPDHFGTGSEGLHHIRVEAIVAGGTTPLPPLEFDATVECAPASKTALVSETTQVTRAPTGDSNASSCGIGPSRQAGFGMATAAAATVGVALLRRRRRKD